jgi:hypothetical protein
VSAIRSVSDAKRLQHILAAVENVLPPEDVALLAARLDAQPELRATRIERRDDLVRQALRQFGGVQPTRAAKMLAAAIDHRLAGRGDKRPTSDPTTALIDRIIDLNSWKSLGWRQIHNIASASLCNFEEKNCKGAIACP